MAEFEHCWPAIGHSASMTHGADRLVDESAAPSADRPSWGQASDAALVEAARAGHTQAFDVLVERHQRAVYRVCYRFAPRHEDASDLTQDTFLRAYRALGSYRGQASFKTWLYRIAVNAGLSRVAQRTPATELLEEGHLTSNALEQTDIDIDRHRRAVKVRAAIDRLPPRQRAAIIMKVLNDQSHEEAARALGCSVGTVKANVFHALRKLRHWLGES